jgi:3-deoxy-manno-octulosonate cytidylyltransferase (CMP-KDO synthetase)
MSAARAAPSAAAERSVWAVIPARYASSRFPGKPLALLAGRPMIQHTYERTRRAAGVTRVLVATDDERIAAAVRAFGGEAVLTGDAATGTDRIAEAVARESGRAGAAGAPGWVLNVQGDEPLIDAGDLETLIDGLLAVPGALMGTLVHPLQSEGELQDPHVVKAVLDATGKALYFSRAPIPYPRAQSGRLGWRHLGVYLYRTDFLHIFHGLPPTPLSERELLEQLRALEHGYAIHCFEARALGFGVDVPADLARAEALLAELGGRRDGAQP